MIEYLLGVIPDNFPINWETIKGGGLFGLVFYLIWSDRQERKENRDADVKRSEAQVVLGNAILKLTDYLNKKDNK